MKIIVLGRKGQLGRCLNDQLAKTDHDVVYTSREQIDITDFEATKRTVAQINPDIIINAAAYTAVDKAEQEQEKADLINHLAVKNIAEICNQIGCCLVHVSTDYVFDGTSSVPYKEDDQSNPQGIYGLTKLNGELAIQSSGCEYMIIRTAWVFSEYGNNFLKTMLRLGGERDELSVVDDQFGCPTYAQDIASAIVTILSQMNLKAQSGVYHYCGDHPCSWYDFAGEVFKRLDNYGAFVIPTLLPVTTDKYPTLAKRPSFSVLDNSYLYEKFGIVSSNWKKGITSSLEMLNMSSL